MLRSAFEGMLPVRRSQRSFLVSFFWSPLRGILPRLPLSLPMSRRKWTCRRAALESLEWRITRHRSPKRWRWKVLNGDNQTSQFLDRRAAAGGGGAHVRWRLELAYVGEPHDHAWRDRWRQSPPVRTGRRCEVQHLIATPTLGQIPALYAFYGFQGQGKVMKVRCGSRRRLRCVCRASRERRPLL